MPKNSGDILGVGLFVPNDPAHLGLMTELLDVEADYFEISPESMWVGSSSGHGLHFHDSFKMYEQFRDVLQKPFVAHGLAYSLGTPLEGEQELARTDDWLGMIGKMHDEFDFHWYSEHLGFTNTCSGLQAILPLPLPYTEEAVTVVSERLKRLQEKVPVVAFENSVFYFTLGDPWEQADFYNRICEKSGASLMLDLHNLYTHCLNFKLDMYKYFDQIEADNVIQFHLSGGSESEASWLKSKNIWRLDSHDSLLPSGVMDLYKYALPKCKNLKGVIVERLNNTLDSSEIPLFNQEFKEIRRLFYELGPKNHSMPAGAPRPPEAIIKT